MGTKNAMSRCVGSKGDDKVVQWFKNLCKNKWLRGCGYNKCGCTFKISVESPTI